MIGKDDGIKRDEASRVTGNNDLTEAASPDRAIRESAMEVKSVIMADLDWEGAVPVRDVGYRYLIPVPDLGSTSEAIQVTTWDGKEVTVNGMGFKNDTDGSLQAVDGDGTGVLIIGVDPEKTNVESFSRAMDEKIAALGGPENLSKESTLEVLEAARGFLKEHAHDSANPQKSDFYNSNDSIRDSLKATDDAQSSGRPLGLFEKAGKADAVAVFVPEKSTVLDGPHLGSAHYESGFLAVRIEGKNGPEYRSIAPEAIDNCYRDRETGNRLATSRLPQAKI